MRFTLAAAAATLVAGVAAGNYNYSTPVYSTPAYYATQVVSSYETYCTEATEVTYNGHTYTATASGYLTITNCPCTITKPVYSAVVTSSTPCATSTPVYTPPYSNVTTCVTSSYPVGTGTPATSHYATFTGAADKAIAASGAGLAAVFGLVLAAL